MTRILVLDQDDAATMIKERKKKGHDIYDEVWDGMYVIPTTRDLQHQKIVVDLTVIFGQIQARQGGEVYPGANVSDRNQGWKDNYRCPDVPVVLPGSCAIPRKAHFQGGPDLVVEIHSPGDDSELKLGFYEEIGVREFFLLHRDTRRQRLYRHNGQELVRVNPTLWEGKRWLVSEVLPLAFRRIPLKKSARTQVRRTDGEAGTWKI